jgi:hypothetical protein
MKTIETTIYECDFCGKYYKRKNACERHEIICFHNPANKRACFSCGNLRKKDTEIEGYFQNHKVNGILFCNKYNEFLYTPQNKIKGNWLEFAQPMKNKCEFWREQNYDDMIEQNSF